MKRYIENIQATHTPHERRQVAMRFATLITAVLFVAWLATLSVRMGGIIPATAQESSNNGAAVLEAVQNETWRGN